MRSSMQQMSDNPQCTSGDSSVPMLARALTLALKRTGWTHDALTAHLRERDILVSRPLITHMLSGQKPLRASVIDALPVNARRELWRVLGEMRELWRVLGEMDGVDQCDDAIVLLQRALGGLLRTEARS